LLTESQDIRHKNIAMLVATQFGDTRPFEPTPNAVNGGAEELEKSVGTTNGALEIDECR